MKAKERMTVISTEDFVEGKDFEIVTYFVVDDSDRFQTVESYFHIDQLELINQYPNPKDIINILQIHALFNREPEGLEFIQKTPMFKMPVYFYRLNDLAMNLELLISLGFGIVRMHNGDCRGELLLYDMYYFRNLLYEDGEEWDNPLIGDTALRIAIYFSIMDPKFDDRDLEILMNKSEDFVKILCMCNGDEIIQKLKDVFAAKKGGDNVIPFSRLSTNRK